MPLKLEKDYASLMVLIAQINMKMYGKLNMKLAWKEQTMDQIDKMSHAQAGRINVVPDSAVVKLPLLVRTPAWLDHKKYAMMQPQTNGSIQQIGKTCIVSTAWRADPPNLLSQFLPLLQLYTLEESFKEIIIKIMQCYI